VATGKARHECAEIRRSPADVRNRDDTPSGIANGSRGDGRSLEDRRTASRRLEDASVRGWIVENLVAHDLFERRARFLVCHPLERGKSIAEDIGDGEGLEHQGSQVFFSRDGAASGPRWSSYAERDRPGGTGSNGGATRLHEQMGKKQSKQHSGRVRPGRIDIVLQRLLKLLWLRRAQILLRRRESLATKPFVSNRGRLSLLSEQKRLIGDVYDRGKQEWICRGESVANPNSQRDDVVLGQARARHEPRQSDLR